MVRFKIYIISLLILWLFTGKQLNADESILAVVNEEVITSKDLKDFLNFMRLQYSSEKDKAQVDEDLERMKPELLKKLVEDRLILQEAKRLKINIDKNLLSARIEQIKKRYPTDRDFQEALNAQGLTLADIENRIREQMLIYQVIEKNIKSKVVIHPEEVNLFYTQHKEKFLEPEKRELFVFIFNNELDAHNLKEKLKQEGIDKAINDSYLNIKHIDGVERGQLKKEFDEVVFLLKENEVSEVIKMDNQYYIFFLKKIIPAYQKSLEEVKGNIYNILFEKKMDEELDKWLDQLYKKSYVQFK